MKQKIKRTALSVAGNLIMYRQLDNPVDHLLMVDHYRATVKRTGLAREEIIRQFNLPFDSTFGHTQDVIRLDFSVLAGP